MHIITKKVTLKPAPFVGTRITVNIAENLTFTLCDLTLADTSESVTVSWGDGPVETFASHAVCTHTYSHPGRYEVRISDDVRTFTSLPAQTDTDRSAIIAVVSNARNLTVISTGAFGMCVNLATLDIDASAVNTLGYAAFADCVSLPARLDLHGVRNLLMRGELLPFSGSTTIREFHFSEANEAAVKASAAYTADQTLGTGTAVCVFDP